jgi:catechol 2,3-dioxygenase-like lactoylglutathione lyase family enzyme
VASVLKLQHTSIPMPSGGQSAARDFFGGVLGMSEVPPPSTLDRAKLVWFKAGPDGHEIHLFVDPGVDRRSNAQHLCLQVDDLSAYRAKLTKHGVDIQETDAIRNRPRFFVHDPFNNLIEITQIDGEYD